VSPQVTVLVVDDDPTIRLLCRINLELDGHAVVEAGAIGEARALLQSEAADVVLLDVHVAGEDGREFLSELRRDRPDLPVALLTGSVERADVSGSDADALIPKPFTIDELRDTVRRLSAGRLTR
jgi:DNA-binding response OmpR family regulator